jgi:hypothetical protein
MPNKTQAGTKMPKATSIITADHELPIRNIGVALIKRTSAQSAQKTTYSLVIPRFQFTIAHHLLLANVLRSERAQPHSVMRAIMPQAHAQP